MFSTLSESINPTSAVIHTRIGVFVFAHASSICWRIERGISGGGEKVKGSVVSLGALALVYRFNGFRFFAGFDPRFVDFFIGVTFY